MTKITYIPGEIANAAIDEHGNRKPVTRTQHIFDDAKGKRQSVINQEVDEAIGNDETPDSIKGRIKELENQVGEGGTVDERIEEAVAPKANSADVYTKVETYNKTELNNMITTPNQKYVTVTATDQTTDVTDVLPATGAADTVYRVGNWDGSQFDATVYSEYAWNGSAYVHLNTKTQIGEVFDISAYHATGGTFATYEDLEAALDSENGGGVPVEVRRGGMSVKFVCTSDNKYVQYRLMAQSFTTDVTQWQGVDNEPTAESENLIKSGGVHSELYTRNEIGYEFNSTDTNKRAGYIKGDGDIGSQTSTAYLVHYFPISIGDKFLLTYESFTSSVGRAYAIYSTDNPNELSSDTAISVGPVGRADTDFNIEITDSRAKLLCVSILKEGGVYNVWNAELTKILYVSKFDEVKNNTIERLIASRDYTISGNVVYDTNGIPQSYDITWSDETIGTVVMSNFNNDVFEYTTITATYDDKTIIYSLTYDLNGYITNETFNIQ